MQIISQLINIINVVIRELYDLETTDVKLEQTNLNFKGDFTLVVFPYLRQSKKGPEQTAEEIGNMLKTKAPDIIENFNVVKGFLNLELSDALWLDYLRSVYPEKEIAISPIGKGKKVVVEYSSPNTNKPLHLGHVRNNLLGYSFCKILETNGYTVIKNNLVNDRGIHICKSMIAWLKFGNGESPESSGMKGDHLVGKYYVEFDKAYKAELVQLKESGLTEEEAEQQSTLMAETRQMLQKWEAGDRETLNLWKKMNAWVYAGFDETYKNLGISFDKIYYESETYLRGKDIVEEGLASGVFYRNEDGSIWVNLSEEGLEHKLLLRSDGTSVYMTQDLGTAVIKYEDFKMDQSIYVVGNEQDYHFKVLQAILKKLNMPFAEGIHHLSYGMVDLPSGKMKSREGTVVDADDLIKEMISTARKNTEELGKTEGMEPEELERLYQDLGLGALKYFLLKVDARKRMLFDPEESIDFQGNTGPFIQYTYTRITSILRSVKEKTAIRVGVLEEEERHLLLSLYDYENKVNQAAEEYNPSLITQSVYEIAKNYNKFYHQHSILGASDPAIRAMRIALSEQTGKTLQHGMGLLGIEMPKRM